VLQNYSEFYNTLDYYLSTNKANDLTARLTGILGNIMSDAHPKVGLHSPFGNPLLVWQQHPARVTWRLLIKSRHCLVTA